jgi:hypothetical protein
MALRLPHALIKYSPWAYESSDCECTADDIRDRPQLALALLLPPLNHLPAFRQRLAESRATQGVDLKTRGPSPGLVVNDPHADLCIKLGELLRKKRPFVFLNCDLPCLLAKSISES